MTGAPRTAPERTAAPSFAAVAAQPKWLLMLLACLGVAAAFIGLGKWQLDAAIAAAHRPEQASADAPATPLGEHLRPQQPLFERSIGARVWFEGVLDPADLEVLDRRLQGDRDGAWIIGRAHVSDDGATVRESAPTIDDTDGMPVAIAWAPDAAAAESALAGIRAQLAPREEVADAAALDAASARFEGALEYGQAPSVPGAGAPPEALEEMAPAYLVNRWSVPSGEAYDAYVTLDAGAIDLPAGVEPIQRQLADAGGELNWLNIFYAIEWAIFAGFALYLWWRLVREEQRGLAAAALGDPADRIAEDLRRERLRAIRDARRAADGADGPGAGPRGGS